jgi:transcriptional regulator with XRE-family HTH domain
MPLPSNSACAELRSLGENISIARKRRRMTIKRLAEAASVAPETIRRLEKGEPGVSVGTLVMVLLVLGESGRLGNVLTPPTDDIGMILSVHDLPKRVREKGKKTKTASRAENTPQGTRDNKYVGF